MQKEYPRPAAPSRLLDDAELFQADSDLPDAPDYSLRSEGRIDVLVNNAGIDTLGAIEDIGPQFE